ncbi:hypothetical protein HMPREF0742_02200 [Rothia aeria F0184]|uniref:Uncharacterized protein n=1 Tax=Rothia aeria F0184 TaxID=888019 RepID=U7UY96_9MICC|nr:hypothetical protein HMPREF0742_02200 [Rothia aeria F0184]
MCCWLAAAKSVALAGTFGWVSLRPEGAEHGPAGAGMVAG